jgi:hypothetical protein
MSLKNRSVIINDEGEFLSFDLIRWVDSDNAFYITPNRALAIRQATAWWKRNGRKLDGSRRVFVVTNYGFTDEMWEEVDKNGRIGKPFYPNERWAK